MATGQTGFQPRNTPAERRAFFDAQRITTGLDARTTDLDARVAALEAALTALAARVADLEAP
jgi:uncharacterized protein YceH (UPF0502 family)